MSVLWTQERDGERVEIRSAGRTRRLYVDGVLHTSWSPARPLTGAVWDHLALSTFFVAPEGAERVLVLGVGGGAVLRLLETHAPPRTSIGVERDGLLLDLGRRWFGLDECGAQLVRADAVAWVRRHAARRFDLVVDDLFVAAAGEPVRPAELDGDWWRRLARLVAPGGALVVNFAEHHELVGSAVCQDTSLRARFPAAYRFSCPGYENAAAVLLREPVSARVFRDRIRRRPTLRGAEARRLLRFRVHRLWPR